MKKNLNLTEGPVLKSIFILAIPIIFGNLLQTAYQLIDTFWVGRLGANAVAAVSLSFPVIFLSIAIGGGIGLAGSVLVSQYKGRGDQESVNHFTGQAMLISFLIAAFFTVIGYFSTPFIVSLLGAAPAVYSMAVSYLQISFLGLIFVFGYLVFQSLMRGIGDAKTLMYIVLVTVLLNAILDPLLIFGFWKIPAFGVGGAAIATIATQGVAILIGLSLLIRGWKGTKLQVKHLVPDFNVIKTLVTLGLPSSMEQSTRAIGFIIMTGIVASFGTIALASYGIGFRVISFVIIPALSLSIANSTLVGQNIGAGKKDRAEKIVKMSTLIGFVVLTLAGTLLYVFAPELVALFVPGALGVIANGAQFIRIMAFSFGFVGIQMAMNGAIRGSGKTVTTFLISFVVLVVQVGSALVLSKLFGFGTIGIWFAFPIANVFGALIAYSIFASGSWKRHELIKKKELVKEVQEEVLGDEEAV